MKKTNKSIKLLKAEIIEQLCKIDDKNALIDILNYTNTFDVTPIKKFETNNEEIYLKNIAGEHWYAGGLSSSRDDVRDNFGQIQRGIFKLKK